MKKVLGVILVIILIAGVFGLVDYTRVNNNEDPIFVIETNAWDDGGTKEYTGLGYKVFKYVDMLSGDTALKFGGLNMEYNNPFDETRERLELEKEEEQARQEAERQKQEDEYLGEMSNKIGQEIEFEQVRKQTPIYKEDAEPIRKDIVRNTIELEGYLTEYDNESLKNIFQKYNDNFFKEHTLVIVTIVESSGSDKENVKNVTRKDMNTIEVLLERDHPETGTADMATWHLMLEINSKDMQGVADADIVY